MALNYFYAGQTRRYLEQLRRVFSSFQISLGTDAGGLERFYTVPCIYGDSDRMALHIKNRNSESTLIPTPFIAVWDADIIPDPERRQNPNFVGKKQFIERNFKNNEYGSSDGYRYTIERLMPIPYRMTAMADIWYTQTDHKFQICEQIMMLFNDDLDIQTNTNPLDWSALTILKMNNIVWNNRGVPVGVDDGIRTTSFQFEVPIWINPPAKVKQQKLIQNIITNIYETGDVEISDTVSDIQNSFEGILNVNDSNFESIFNENNEFERIVVTPGNHYIKVEDNIITLLGSDQGEINPKTNTVWNWSTLIAEYGKLQENISMLRLRPVNNIEETEFDFIGRISLDPNNVNKLIWTVDLETIPVDTLPSIDAIIDPIRNEPGGDLPVPSIGTRYLIFNDLPSPTQAWGDLIASTNDIIEFNGASWFVSFDASLATTIQHTTNEFTGKKLKYDPTEQEWVIIPDGVFIPGFWRLSL